MRLVQYGNSVSDHDIFESWRVEDSDVTSADVVVQRISHRTVAACAITTCAPVAPRADSRPVSSVFISSHGFFVLLLLRFAPCRPVCL